MAGNSFFQFKEFVVHQDQCAMKVCTDACAFGAIMQIENVARLLDIGTGTGLLSLMAAQRNQKTHIDAVEIDQGAFQQASDNVAASPFAGKIKVYHTPVQDFHPDLQYDMIVSNPPFFQSDLKSPSSRKNMAHHADTLSFDQLLKDARRLLTDQGLFQVLLPVEESFVFQRKAEIAGWFVTSETLLMHDPGKKPFRRILTLKKGISDNDNCNISSVEIYSEGGKEYSQRFRELLKPFYLIF